MESIKHYKAIDGTIFEDKAECESYETALKMGDALEKFIAETYTKGMDKNTYKTIIQSNLKNLASLYESARPKKNRRTKEEMEQARAMTEDKPAPKKNKAAKNSK